jgi:hypothetical protein
MLPVAHWLVKVRPAIRGKTCSAMARWGCGASPDF